MSFLGTVINKPIEDAELFREIMAWTCDPANNAMMYEYNDRYEVREAPAEEETNEEGEMPEETDYVTVEERLDDIENALIELAEMLTSAE